MELKFNSAEFSEQCQRAINKMQALDAKASEHAAQIISDLCDKLLVESIKRTPIDEGFLIASQKKTVEKGAEVKNVVGHVYIPANAPGSDYALYIHEGHYTLGAKSQQKQASTDVIIGRKFLERAFHDNKKAFETYIIMKIKEFLSAK
jgi:hypothetical protein